MIKFFKTPKQRAQDLWNRGGDEMLTVDKIAQEFRLAQIEALDLAIRIVRVSKSDTLAMIDEFNRLKSDLLI